MKRFGQEVGKVGFVASCWDLLHAGHCLFLKDAKAHCDYLIAGLQTDPTIDRPEKNKPIMSFKERRILLESNKYVNEILVYETEKDLFAAIKKIKPDVRILGDDYIGRSYTAQGYENEVYYHDRSSHGLSTTKLRKRIQDNL
jgi:glycerol-3-phosphate cytidylyltransferase